MTAALKILIVEDDIHSAFILKSILAKAGYKQSQTVSRGEEALTIVDQDPPALILMDITLSGKMDGIETAKRIQQKREIPIIYLTGYSADDVILRVKNTYPYGFIIKPYDPKSVVIVTEMALHKAAIERESMETKRRLAITLGTLQNAIFSTDKSTHITYLNDAAKRLIGLPLLKVLKKPLDQFFTFQPVKAQAENFKTFLAFADKLENNEVFLLNKHDKTAPRRYVHIQVSTLFDLYQKPNGYVISIHDRTDQFYYQQNNKKLASALTLSHEGIVIAKFDSRLQTFVIEYMNQGLKQLLGSESQALEGKPLAQLLERTSGQNLEPILKQRQAYSTEMRLENYEGKILHTQWRLTPSAESEDGNDYMVCTINDITHLHQLEENLRQTQKAEAVGRLASGIAHDFNNLLSVINGYTELLLQKIPQEEAIYTYAKQIHEAGHKEALLIKQLMSFSRHPSQVEAQLISVQTTIQNTLQMLQYWNDESIQLRFHIEEGLWPLYIREDQIDQILVNLCVNAKDAMPQGGQINVCIENFTGTPQTLSPGHYLRLSVQDTGTGMDEVTREKIFDPFFTTKPIGKGTGLGLFSVYGIVQQQKGAIQIESQLGRGTTFTIYLPAFPQIEKLPQRSQKVSKTPLLSLKRTTYLYHLPPILADALYNCLLIQQEHPCICQEIPKQLQAHECLIVPQSLKNSLTQWNSQLLTLPDADCSHNKFDENPSNSDISHPYALCEILESIRKAKMGSF